VQAKHLVMEWTRELWKQIFTRADRWARLVRQVLRAHGLDERAEVVAGHPGSNAVFRCGDLYVKLYPPLWPGSFARERELYALLGQTDLPVPKLIAAGTLVGRPEVDGAVDEPWPYVVVTRVEGERVGGCWGALSRREKAGLVRQLAPLVRELHSLPVDSLSSFDRDWPGFVRRQAAASAERHRRTGSLPAHLCDQIDSYLAQVLPELLVPFTPRLLHADITNHHLLVTRTAQGWAIGGMIDFGDAEVGHPEYEFVVIGQDLLEGDGELFQAYLVAYGYQQETALFRRLTAYTLIHRFWNFRDTWIGDRLERLRTLPDLERALWR
jgi:hygromycin-B 7''-O-kinase